MFLCLILKNQNKVLQSWKNYANILFANRGIVSMVSTMVSKTTSLSSSLSTPANVYIKGSSRKLLINRRDNLSG